MSAGMMAFLIWLIVSCAFIALGIYAYTAKKETAFGFWANAGMFPVENVRAYNRAVGKLWCVFGVVFAVIGIPLLSGKNSAWVLVTVLGAMAETIVAMVVYVNMIERKYRKK